MCCNPLGNSAFVPRPFDRDIRDFGATPSNGAQAIMDAIADLPITGGRIIVPAGTWDAPIEVLVDRVGVQIIGGHGSVLRKVNADHHVIRLGGSASFCMVQGLNIDGNHVPQGSLITCNGSDNTVFDCHLHDNGVMADPDYANASHGVTFDGQTSTCERNLVLACTINANHDIGVSQHTARGNRVQNCEIIGNGLEGVTIDVTSHFARVLDNLIQGSCVRGGVGGIGIDGSDLWMVKGNQIIGTLNGLSGMKTQNNTGASNFGIFTDNLLLDNTGWGAWFFTGTGGGASLHSINGNVLRGNTTGSIRLEVGSDNNHGAGNQLNGVAISNAGAGNVFV